MSGSTPKRWRRLYPDWPVPCASSILPVVPDIGIALLEKTPDPDQRADGVEHRHEQKDEDYRQHLQGEQAGEVQFQEGRGQGRRHGDQPLPLHQTGGPGQGCGEQYPQEHCAPDAAGRIGLLPGCGFRGGAARFCP